MVCKVCMYVLLCKVFVKAMMLLIHISERASGNPNLLFSNMQLLWRNSFSSKPNLASKTRKISEGKKGGKKCSPNRMHVCWKYCRSSYSEALIPKNTSYVQVGFHTQVLYCTLGLACIEFWVTCTIKIVYLWSYCYTSCVLLKENWKKNPVQLFLQWLLCEHANSAWLRGSAKILWCSVWAFWPSPSCGGY